MKLRFEEVGSSSTDDPEFFRTSLSREGENFANVPLSNDDPMEIGYHEPISLAASPMINMRKIFINDKNERNEEQKFSGNDISTSKYNLLTFLPKFLFEQFSRYANLFFLFISIIQQIPNVSPTGSWTTITPLSVVLAVTAIKELLEDWVSIN
jgi:hypothetical protein